jgi:hypothetical protein
VYRIVIAGCHWLIFSDVQEAHVSRTKVAHTAAKAPGHTDGQRPVNGGLDQPSMRAANLISRFISARSPVVGFGHAEALIV